MCTWFSGKNHNHPCALRTKLNPDIHVRSLLVSWWILTFEDDEFDAVNVSRVLRWWCRCWFLYAWSLLQFRIHHKKSIVNKRMSLVLYVLAVNHQNYATLLIDRTYFARAWWWIWSVLLKIYNIQWQIVYCSFRCCNVDKNL